MHFIFLFSLATADFCIVDQSSTPSLPHHPILLQMPFAAPEKKRSKIWLALNPQRLHHETAKDRREREEDKTALDSRKTGQRGYQESFQLMSDMAMFDDGVDLDAVDDAAGDSDDESEEEVDLANLPDFGELETEMMHKRRERALADQQRREELRKQHEERVRRESEEREAEMLVIQEKFVVGDLVPVCRCFPSPTSTTFPSQEGSRGARARETRVRGGGRCHATAQRTQV